MNVGWDSYGGGDSAAELRPVPCFASPAHPEPSLPSLPLNSLSPPCLTRAGTKDAPLQETPFVAGPEGQWSKGEASAAQAGEVWPKPGTTTWRAEAARYPDCPLGAGRGR